MSSDATTPIDRRIRGRSSPATASSPRASSRPCSRSPDAAISSFPSPSTTLGVEDIEALLRQRMLEADVRVIFTDLQAGSCTMASRRILRGMDDAVLIAGVESADAARFRVR